MEKKSENKLEEPRSNIVLENRKKLTLTGVEEVISFDDEKILLNCLLSHFIFSSLLSFNYAVN